MSQVTDVTLDNQGFSTFRTELNNILGALNSFHSGTSRPGSATTGTIWLDTTNASSNSLELKFFDGSDDIQLAVIDTSANTVNFIDSTVTAATELLNDTSPQLGGNLDTNSHNILFDDAHGINDDSGNELIVFQKTSSAVNQIDVTNAATGNAPEISATGGDTNIDLKLTPKGSGNLNLDGLKFPNADGSADQVLKTDGGGNLSFTTLSAGGTSWQSSIKTADFTAVAGEGYFINTSGGAVTMTLPSSASVGDEVEFLDFSRSWGTNACTVNRNSHKFQGGTQNPVYDTDGQAVRIVYSGVTNGWIPTSDEASDLEGISTYGIEYLCVAGGGSGGRRTSGGGGAGGFTTNFTGTKINLQVGSVYTVTVGAGGTAPSSEGIGVSGSNSVLSGAGITTITAIGGGGGGNGSNAGLDGGSGGGSGTFQTSSVGAGTSGQGNNGGTGIGNTQPYTAGGGGGASATGANASPGGGGAGGAGTASTITGSSVTRAGGGGGSSYGTGGSPAGSGGSGGGGAGHTGPSAGSATAGTANTGGGGGGTPFAGDSAGNGGSGVVILRVPTASFSSTTSGSPTTTTSGSDTIMVFTASGSYTG